VATLKSLGDELPKEMARVREVKRVYESLAGGSGLLAAGLMEASLQAADKAVISGDVVAMIQCYQDLQGWQL
jgi:hypothetical protein